MNYRVRHTTTYSYSEPVSLCQNVAHLTPRPGQRQVCRSSQVLITPQPSVTAAHTDYFGNPATFFALQEPHRQLSITATHRVEVKPFAAPEPGRSPSWEEVRDRVRRERAAETIDAYQFVFDSPYVQTSRDLVAYAAASFPPGRPLLEAARDLTHRIHREFRYDQQATTVATPLRTVLAHRRGVCQDFAHLQIGCLRSLGLPARYVSGYLSTVPPPGRPRLIGADASHAWLSVWCPGSGWIDLDPTNDVVPSERHVLLAWGRDYDDVSPVKGVILGGGQHTVTVGVDVVPVDEQGP